VNKDSRYTITTLWTNFFYEYFLEDEQELSVGEMLTVYFGTPSLSLHFGLDLIMELNRH
jgi:hypothetical protein